MDNWMNEWTADCIEEALGFKLYDWQKDYIFSNPVPFTMGGRRIGLTTAYIIKLIISEGPPIRLGRIENVRHICDSDNGINYLKWFEYEFTDIYYKLSHTKLKRVLRKVVFDKKGA